MENKKRKLEEARIGKTGNKIMKRTRTGKWVVTAMLGLIVIGTTTVEVGAEQSGEQEVAVEESVAQDESTVLIERVSWKANSVDQVTVEIDKQSNEKDQDPLKDYTIVWGDTLWAISLSTGTSVEELVELNNIVNPDLIYAGDVLLLADGTSIEVTPEHVSGTQEDSTQDVTEQETSKQETNNKGTSGTEGNGTNVSDNTQTGTDTDKDGDTVTEDDKDKGNFVGEKPKDEKPKDDGKDGNGEDEGNKDEEEGNKEEDNKEEDNKEEDNKEEDNKEEDNKEEDNKEEGNKDEEEDNTEGEGEEENSGGDAGDIGGGEDNNTDGEGEEDNNGGDNGEGEGGDGEPETPVNPTLPPSEREVGYTEKGNINNDENVDPTDLYGHLYEEEYVIPYETVDAYGNPIIEEGHENVLLEGVNGIEIHVYDVTILGGGDYQRTLVDKIMIQNPINRILDVR